MGTTTKLPRKGSRHAQIRVVMLPKDTNAMGNIFGGVILSHIDLAAAEHCRGVAPHLYVTKFIDSVEFIAPVMVGDTVSFYTETIRVGTTSIRVRVTVEVERGVDHRKVIRVTVADIVMVAVDEAGKPTPIFPRRSTRVERRKIRRGRRTTRPRQKRST